MYTTVTMTLYVDTEIGHSGSEIYQRPLCTQKCVHVRQK